MLAGAVDGADDAAGQVTQREFSFWPALAPVAATLRGRRWQLHATVTNLLGQPR